MKQNPHPIKAVKLVAILLLISLCVSMFSCRNETPPKEEGAPNDSVQPQENKKEPQENKKAFRDNEDLGQLYCALVDNEISRPRSVAMVVPYYFDATDTRPKQSKSYSIAGTESVSALLSILDEVEKHCTLTLDRETALEQLVEEKIPAVSTMVNRSSVYLLYGSAHLFRISVYERHVVMCYEKTMLIFDTDISMQDIMEEMNAYAKTGWYDGPEQSKTYLV